MQSTFLTPHGVRAWPDATYSSGPADELGTEPARENAGSVQSFGRCFCMIKFITTIHDSMSYETTSTSFAHASQNRCGTELNSIR